MPFFHRVRMYAVGLENGRASGMWRSTCRPLCDRGWRSESRGGLLLGLLLGNHVTSVSIGELYTAASMFVTTVEFTRNARNFACQRHGLPAGFGFLYKVWVSMCACAPGTGLPGSYAHDGSQRRLICGDTCGAGGSGHAGNKNTNATSRT